MTKLEVEHRGELTEEKFNELKSFLSSNGKAVAINKRFSVIYSQRKDDSNKDPYQHPIDLKVRITNKKSELVLKYGEWSGSDARREFLFPLENEKFEEMIEFLKILGNYHGVLQATTTYLYQYKEIDFSLVVVPDWGYYFEAEIMTEEENTNVANKKIDDVCKELGVKVLDHDGFLNLLRSLNDRPGYRFNFKKQNFSEIKKRFTEYF